MTQVMDVLRAWRASVQRPGAGAGVKTAPAVYPCGAGGRPGRWRVRHSWPTNCPIRYFQKPEGSCHLRGRQRAVPDSRQKGDGTVRSELPERYGGRRAIPRRLSGRCHAPCDAGSAVGGKPARLSVTITSARSAHAAATTCRSPGSGSCRRGRGVRYRPPCPRRRARLGCAGACGIQGGHRGELCGGGWAFGKGSRRSPGAGPASFGDPVLEVDHIHDLALGGPDDPAQMIALCPNCHAVKTRGGRESNSGRCCSPRRGSGTKHCWQAAIAARTARIFSGHYAARGVRVPVASTGDGKPGMIPVLSRGSPRTRSMVRRPE